MAPAPTALPTRNQHSRRARGRRCAQRQHQAGRFRRGRGLDRDRHGAPGAGRVGSCDIASLPCCQLLFIACVACARSLDAPTAPATRWYSTQAGWQDRQSTPPRRCDSLILTALSGLRQMAARDRSSIASVTRDATARLETVTAVALAWRE